MKVEELPIPQSVKKVVVESGLAELYPPQADAIKAGALEGKNLVLASPTASGKTLVAELCAMKHILERGGKVIYLTPLRALASEKYEEFKKYTKLEKRRGEKIKITLSTGDYDSSDPWLGRYDIIICSVDYNEPVLIRNNGQVQSMRIGEFVDITAKHSTSVTSQNGIEVINVSNQGYETLAFNPETLRIEFKKISKLIRHKINEPLYRITLETGRHVSVTSSHSLFLLDGLEVRAIKTSEIKVGDYVIIPKHLPINDNLEREINLATNFAGLVEAENLYIAGLPEYVFNSASFRSAKFKRHEKWNWRRRRHIPLREALKLNLVKDLPHNCYFSYVGVRHKVPVAIHVCGELLRLLGYYVAEGSFDEKNYKVSFAFNSIEEEYVDDLRKCVARVFNVAPSITRRKNVIYVEICNKVVFLFLRKVLGLRKGAHDKEIPTIVYNLDSSLQLEFLKAALRGDGTPSYIQTRYCTVNPKLASDILCLLLHFGVVASLFTRESTVTLPSGQPFRGKTYYVAVNSREQLSRISQALGDADPPETLTRICFGPRVSMVPSTPLYSILDPLMRQRTTKVYTHFGKRMSFQRLLRWINSHENNVRLECLRVLNQEGETTSGRLSEILSLNWWTANDRLRRMMAKGLVKREGRSGHCKYFIDKKGLELIKNIDMIQQLAQGDLAFAKVKKIEKVPSTTEYVYDFSVPGCENFIAGHGGIVCHNTNEKADSLLRHRARWMSEISLVVADEVHLLSDVERGPTLEVVIARLLQINPKIQILALSATIKNADEIAEWLKAESITTEWRPVKLKEGVYLDGDAVFNDGSAYKIAEAYRDPALNLSLNILKQKGQALIFAETRKMAVTIATRTAAAVKKTLSQPEQRILKTISDQIARAGEKTRISNLLAELATNGVAFHHAGLHSAHRKIIEDAFREGKIKIIAATPTLAAGVNLPARMVVVHSYERYEPGYGRYPISVLEYKQMCGRAGRPKYDPVGEALLIASTADEQDYLMETYVFAEPERLWSKLAVERVLRSHVLATVATGFAHTEQGVYDFFNKTFYAIQYDPRNIKGIIGKVLKFLSDEEMIKFERDKVIATEFGRRISELYIDPVSAIVIREGLLNRAKILTDLSLLHMVSHTPDMYPKFYPRQREIDELAIYLEEHRDEFMFEAPEEWTDKLEYDEFLAELKSVRVIESWIDELSEDDIIEKYRVEPGDLFRMVENADWLLYAIHELAQLFQHKDILPKLSMLRGRVEIGVKPELLPLVKLKGIGRIRGRMLHNAGFKTIEHLKHATITQLTNIPLIGPQLAKTIKEQIGGLVKPEEWQKLKVEKWDQKILSEY